MSRYFIQLSYLGTHYNGWQNQPHKGVVSIQGTIEKVLSTVMRQNIQIVGCGRTDTGVHAQDYWAHFDAEPIENPDSLVFRANKVLPDDIAINKMIAVDDHCHARFDAFSRSYRYHLHLRKSPFVHQSYLYLYDEPNLDLLNEAAALILQFEDFTTFCKVNTDAKTKVCQIESSYWLRDGNQLVYYVKSDRFLRGMIRLIVGMCLNVSRGKLTIEEVRSALENKERLSTDWSVPAVGLTLYDVKYPYIG